MEYSFSPHNRSNEELIKMESELIKKTDLFTSLINSLQDFIIIMSTDLEIIFANKSFIEFTCLKDSSEIIGKRICEIVKCTRSDEKVFNYNDITLCDNCSITQSVLKSLNEGITVQTESTLKLKTGNTMDFQITTLPLEAENNKLVVCLMRDISEQNRKKSILRIFIHDILNSAGALQQCLNLMDLHNLTEASEILLLSRNISDNLIDEITSQRLLLEAENNEYEPNVTIFDSCDILDMVTDKSTYNFISGNKEIQITQSEHVSISSDKTLLSRVVFNLLKNALEATSSGGTVELSCVKRGNEIEYIVKSENVIPPDIQPLIFSRTFSTKGKGRGIGTYSIKLLTDKYLKGKISFESNEEIGTVFHAVYPITLL